MNHSFIYLLFSSWGSVRGRAKSYAKHSTQFLTDHGIRSAYPIGLFDFDSRLVGIVGIHYIEEYQDIDRSDEEYKILTATATKICERLISYRDKVKAQDGMPQRH